MGIDWLLEAKIMKLLDWLCPEHVHPLYDQAMYKQHLTDNTAVWIFEHSMYKEWRFGSVPFLWISGKSIDTIFEYENANSSGRRKIRLVVLLKVCKILISLRSSIIDNLSAYASEKPSIGLLWFYCDGSRNISAKTEPRYILGSVLRQLWELLIRSKGSQDTITLIQRLQEKSRCVVDSKLVGMMIEAIHSIAKHFHEVYIVIDGIDECSAQTDLCKIAIELAVVPIKVLVTSRPEREISEIFFEKIQLEITEEISSADISTHVDWIFRNDLILKKIKLDLKGHIMSQLVSRNNGVKFYHL